MQRVGHEQEALFLRPIALGMPWENYVRLLTWVPLVIGVHMGVTLLVSGVNRQLFVPNLALPVNLLGGLLGMVTRKW